MIHRSRVFKRQNMQGTHLHLKFFFFPGSLRALRLTPQGSERVGGFITWPPERTGEMRGSLQAGEPAAGLCAACEHLTSETGSSRMLAPATRESWRLLRTGERRAPLGRPFLQLPESGALVPTSIPPTPAPDQRDD